MYLVDIVRGLQVIEELYNIDPKSRYFGVYNLFRPTLYVKDSALLTRILKTDWEHFTHRGFYYSAERDPLSANLFNLSGKASTKEFISIKLYESGVSSRRYMFILIASR